MATKPTNVCSLVCSPLMHIYTKFEWNLTLSKFRPISRQYPVAAILDVGSEQNEETLYRIFHTSFLQSYNSFALVVSEEKIFKISANQKQVLPMVAMLEVWSARNEQTLYRTSHTSFLPSLVPIGPVVSEEMITIWKVNDVRRTPSDGNSSPGPLGQVS